jgi:DUF971 family protein
MKFPIPPCVGNLLRAGTSRAPQATERWKQIAVWWIVGGVAPIDIQPIGSELAIKWEDGSESFVSLEKLRRACPCAGCKGEMDIMGNLYKNPDKPLLPLSFQLKRLDRVGTYAIKPVWGDGHESGLFSFDYLKRLTE